MRAQRWVTESEADLHCGMWIDPEAGRETFGDYAERWGALQTNRPTTATQVEDSNEPVGHGGLEDGGGPRHGHLDRPWRQVTAKVLSQGLEVGPTQRYQRPVADPRVDVTAQ